MGEVKILLHRPVEGAPKTAAISRSSTGKWYACFSCECAEPSPLPETGQPVGIDVGLKTFAALSTGTAIANPRFFRREEKALAKVQRAHRKMEMGAPERATHRHVVARVHERIAWRRGDFAHQHSHRLVNQFDLIAVEDLSVTRMTRNPGQDVATLPDESRFMHERIDGSRLVIIPDAGHTSSVEAPAAVTAAIHDFLAALRP